MLLESDDRAVTGSRSLNFNSDIEVLRAVAIALTVTCHLHNLITWPGNVNAFLSRLNFWGGVDLFFCISGFVIAGSLLRLPRQAGFRQFAVPFYIRRVFRIWPAAILWLLLPVAAAHFFNASGAFGHFKAVLLDGMAAALQVANVYFSMCTTTKFGPCGKEAIYWSLSLEEQFYMLFPLALFFMQRKRLWLVLTAMIALQIALPRWPEHGLWFFRTDAICCGVLIALARDAGTLPRLPRTLAANPNFSGQLALLLTFALAGLTTRPELRINAGLLAMLSGLLVWIASYNRCLIFPWRMLRPFMLWAGSRSYAIYLVHDPCFWATRELFQRLLPEARLHDSFAPAFLLVGLSLVALLAETTYQFVEMPLREFGRQLSERYRPSQAPGILLQPRNS